MTPDAIEFDDTETHVLANTVEGVVAISCSDDFDQTYARYTPEEALRLAAALIVAADRIASLPIRQPRHVG